jgi:hypothetical protein
LALLLGEPPKMLDDLRHLDAESHREVLRGVELLPVSFPAEDPDGTPQIFQTEILPTSCRFVHDIRWSTAESSLVYISDKGKRVMRRTL